MRVGVWKILDIILKLYEAGGWRRYWKKHYFKFFSISLSKPILIKMYGCAVGGRCWTKYNFMVVMREDIRKNLKLCFVEK